MLEELGKLTKAKKRKAGLIKNKELYYNNINSEDINNIKNIFDKEELEDYKKWFIIKVMNITEILKNFWEEELSQNDMIMLDDVTKDLHNILDFFVKEEAQKNGYTFNCDISYNKIKFSEDYEDARENYLKLIKNYSFFLEDLEYYK